MDLQKLLDKNPAVQELKNKFIATNETLIFEQKMNVLQKGGSFPKLPPEKVKITSFLISDIRETLLYFQQRALLL